MAYAASSIGKPPPRVTLKNPEGLLSLDPQLICYSWLTEISEVAFVVFVRKHHPEIQNLRAATQRVRSIGGDDGPPD
jgi:hypothetical protein